MLSNVYIQQTSVHISSTFAHSIDPAFIIQESLANAKVNARQHCVV